jgi:hypothetical protein
VQLGYSATRRERAERVTRRRQFQPSGAVGFRG